MKASGKRTDLLCTSFLSWCYSGFNLKNFLLNFALNGIEKANIDGQIQQRCLPQTSRRHGWCCDTDWKLGKERCITPAGALLTWQAECSQSLEATWSFLLSHWVTAAGSVGGSDCSVLWATQSFTARIQPITAELWDVLLTHGCRRWLFAHCVVSHASVHVENIDLC